MDKALIKNINDVVGVDDTLWHLGDFAFGRGITIGDIILIRRQIKCKNIVLIRGNHDELIAKTPQLSNMFVSVLNWHIVDIEQHSFLLVHRPPEDNCWSKGLIERETRRDPNLIWLHGHTHTRSPFTGRNLCVEKTGYMPLSLQQVLDRVGA
jgi:calcineurin-like phosphoesterase family protein